MSKTAVRLRPRDSFPVCGHTKLGNKRKKEKREKLKRENGKLKEVTGAKEHRKSAGNVPQVSRIIFYCLVLGACSCAPALGPLFPQSVTHMKGSVCLQISSCVVPLPASRTLDLPSPCATSVPAVRVGSFCWCNFLKNPAALLLRGTGFHSSSPGRVAQVFPG